MVVYMQQQQQDGRDGADAQDGLSAFIHSTVTVHSLITDRIDKLQPGEQLTLKVPQSCTPLLAVHTLLLLRTPCGRGGRDIRCPRYKDKSGSPRLHGSGFAELTVFKHSASVTLHTPLHLGATS